MALPAQTRLVRLLRPARRRVGEGLVQRRRRRRDLLDGRTRTGGRVRPPPDHPRAPADGREGASVLVLGPSLGTDLHLFDVQVDALGDEFRIVRYDLPGHGASPAPAGPYTMAGLARDVVALLDRLAIGRVHYVGVSIGGAIGQQIALAFPRASDDPDGARLGRPVRRAVELALLPRPDGACPRHLLDGHQPTRRLAHPRVRGHTQRGGGMPAAHARRDRPGGLRRVLRGDRSLRRAAQASRHHRPRTGHRRPRRLGRTPEMLKLIANGVPDGRYAVVDGAAHLANVEAPQQVTALLSTFLTGRGADLPCDDAQSPT
ncbi:alpha/beta fold hydrolase [Pseudonocardia sp. HH130629-09]|uniref:alpha/beta fold hydrolase n=1 Tax=Pseudonocardia sp. HH130629-09 TaxID=1641402 RepID=UPI0009EC3F9B|nr:alpha/beta fold hydrolase [Pseudonocardia sp. HH130629-09]